MFVRIGSLLNIAALLLLAVDASPIEVYDTQNLQTWSWPKKIKNFVVFGDSLTDEGRLGYFMGTGGIPPPVGFIQGDSTYTSTGGRVWARFASKSANVALYNYAVSGAACSNTITPRFFSSIKANFPSVMEYEIPAFKADFPKGTDKLKMDETLFALLIGGNDLGGDAILTGIPNVGLTNYTSCVFDALTSLHQYGARNFVFMNMIPSEHAALFAPESEGGLPEGPTRYWPTRSGNTTTIARRMRDLVQGANEIFKYRLPTEVSRGSLRGSKVVMMDTYGLITDIRNSPVNYLNGSLPLNVTGYNAHCNMDYVCEEYRPKDRDSFLWFDESHLSEQTNRVIAGEFVKAIAGKVGTWLTYL